MGDIANELAQRFNLKDPAEYAKALAKLNASFDTKLVRKVSTTTPTIDFANKVKITNSANGAELTYPTSETFDLVYLNYLHHDFATHPQVYGLINAQISVNGNHLVVTLPINDAARFQQHEQLLLPNVLQTSWLKYAMNFNTAVDVTNKAAEAKRQAEQKALEFLKS